MHGYPDHTIDFIGTEKGNSCFQEKHVDIKNGKYNQNRRQL